MAVRERQRLLTIESALAIDRHPSQIMLVCELQLLDILNTMDKESLRSGSPGSSSDKGAEHEDTRPRKRHRRGKHHRRKWKPYSKMTATEKVAMDAKEAARAAKREAELKGKPTAPWNTTQFIMEDRGSTDVRIPCPKMSRTTSIESSLSEDEYYESPEEEIMEHGLFLEQDFESAYQEMAVEQLQGMSKTELIQQCLDLEQEVAAMKEQSNNVCNSRITELEGELLKLQGDNKRLREEKEATTYGV